MKVRVSDIVNNVENIKKLQEKELDFKVSYRLKRLVDKLSPILKTYDETRSGLVKKYGEEIENEKGEKVTAVKDPEKLKSFVEELNKVLEVEEDVEFEKIKPTEMEGVKLEANLIVDFIFE